MEGTLWKWTNYFSGWQPRWFVLESGILSYYRAQEDVNNGCKGSIKMSVCDVSVHPTDNTRLDLSIPGEAHFYVKAATPQERQEWLIALGSCKAGQAHSPPPIQTITIPDEDLKAKKSELRLYCDLLMQQVHSVKSAVKSDTTPNVQKLDEATGLLSATCDTFIHTLDECMTLVKSQGAGSAPTTPMSPHSPVTREGVGPPLTPSKSSHSKTSFHSSSVNRSTSADSWSAGGSGDENGIVRGYIPRLQTQRSQIRSRHGSSESSGGTPTQNSPSHQPRGQNSQYSLNIPNSQTATNGISITTNGDSSISRSFPPSPQSQGVTFEESLRSQPINSLSSSSEECLSTTSHSPKSAAQTFFSAANEVTSHLANSSSGGLTVEAAVATVRSHPEDGIRDKIQTFFSAMEISFQDIKLFHDGGIPTPVFLSACKETFPIFDKLNPTTFAPIKMEFSGNVRKLQQKYSTDPDQFLSLQNMVLCEMRKQQHSNANSATVALLWLKRGLHFIREFLLEYMTGIQDLHQASNNAYTRSLKPFHSYVVRGVFAIYNKLGILADWFTAKIVNNQLAAKSAPPRSVFTQSLAVNEFHTKRVSFEQILLRDVEGYVTAADVVLRILDDFYTENGIDFLEQM